jgi:O-methyltransferase
MLNEAEVRHYIEKNVTDEDDILRRLRLRIDELGLPHHEMFPSQIALLQGLAIAIGARRVLELGTFVGYSTIGLAQALDALGGGTIVTVDNDPHALAEARAQFSKLDGPTLIESVQGDADKVCPRLLQNGRRFDLILLDVVETEYAALYSPCVELLRTRGVLVIDNVLMATVAGWTEGANVTDTREDTVCMALREFLSLVASDSRVLSSIIPSGSGLAICVRK